MTFEDKIYRDLEALNPGDAIQLKKNHHNYGRSIKTIIEFMNEAPYQNGIEFNADLTRVRKLLWTPLEVN